MFALSFPRTLKAIAAQRSSDIAQIASSVVVALLSRGQTRVLGIRAHEAWWRIGMIPGFRV